MTMVESQTETVSRIQLLPPHIVNRIAAGEVVERPASVVKELVENAVDAGATQIEITIGNGGRDIRIADNGCGMTAEELKLAFINHATSKIKTLEDLDAIGTLGFRGEALASITSIAKLTCTSRTHDASNRNQNGHQVLFDETQHKTGHIQPAGCAPGTVMEITDLFYNTPARLKFLSRPQTELSHVEEMVQGLALAYPQVRMTLIGNGKSMLKTSGSGEILQTLQEVFQVGSAENLLPVEFHDPVSNFQLTGFAAAPNADKLIKNTRRNWLTFVNQRFVRCPILLKAIGTAYESLVPHGKYPLSVLFLTLPPHDVDVNVHPTKKEVRYRNTNPVFGFVSHGLRESLSVVASSAAYQALGFNAGFNAGNPDGRYGNSPSASQENGHADYAGMSGRSSGVLSARPLSYAGTEPPSPAYYQASFSAYAPLPLHKAVTQREPSDVQEHVEPLSSQDPWRVVGQLFNTYILLETRQGLMVVDQHIASERAWFEHYSRELEQLSHVEVQTQLVGAGFTVTPIQADMLQNARAEFEKLGFTYQVTGSEVAGSEVTLTGVPMAYQARDNRSAQDHFLELLTELEASGAVNKLALDNVLATLSCHTAVRAGDVLSQDQMNHTIRQWLACTLPWTCPHGRPIAHTIKAEDLNRFFHRPSLPSGF